MLKRILYSLVLALLFVAPLSGQVKFDIEAPSVVGQGERFTVKFTANSRVESFNPPTISGAAVLVGPVPSSSSYTQIINGKRSSSYEHTYSYVLQAGDNSVVAISAASATIDGAQYSSRPVTIEVVSDGTPSSQSQQNQYSQQSQQSQQVQQNQQVQYDDDNERDNITYGKADIFLRLHLNKTRVVKGEPIIATLKIYTRSGIAGFEDIKFPVFNGFWSQELESPQNINFAREKVGNQIYNSALLRRYVIIPQQVGTLNIDPAEMVCQVQVMERGATGRSILDDFFGVDTYSIQKKRLVTGKQSVVVQPLPQGAPESFGGTLGAVRSLGPLQGQHVHHIHRG